MSGDDGGAVFGAILLEALFIYGGIPWLYIPWGLVVVACILCVIPSSGGGTAVVYEREPDALDEIAETLRRVERSQYSD